MRYRKLRADYLFDGFTLHESGKVLICMPDGTVSEVVDESLAGTGVEFYKGILSPGLINCHCHLELSHLKDLIPEKQGLVSFILSVLKQRNEPERPKEAAMQQAEQDMLNSGIVAVGDICNGADTVPLKSAGRLAYHNFIEVLGWAPDQAEARFETGQKTAGIFLESVPDPNHLSLSPHAPYSVSEALWKLLKPGFPGKTITIHNQESPAENEFFKYGRGDFKQMYAALKIQNPVFSSTGRSSLASCLPALQHASRLLLVHNTCTEGEDLREALSVIKNPFFCLCPNANLYIENRLPDIPLLMQQGAVLVLGTDSLASNHQLSILEEMKTIKRVFPEIPSSRLLLWATSNGAGALSFGDTLGDFSPGKKPGVVLIENIRDGEIGGESSCRRII